MKMESATRGSAEINGEDIYKMGTIRKHQQHVTMVVIKQTSQ